MPPDFIQRADKSNELSPSMTFVSTAPSPPGDPVRGALLRREAIYSSMFCPLGATSAAMAEEVVKPLVDETEALATGAGGKIAAT